MAAKARGLFAKGGPVRSLFGRSRATSIASGYMIGCYAVVAIVGVTAIRILTGLAPPAVFGEANLLLVSLQLAATVASQPFTTTQLRYHSGEVDAGRGDSFTRAMLMWTCVANGGVSLLAMVVWLVQRRFGASPLGLPGLGGLALLMIATAVRNVNFGRFQAERRTFSYGSLLAIESSTAAIGAIIGLRISPSVDGYIVGQACGSATAALIGLAWDLRTALRTLVTTQPKPRALEMVRSYGLPFAPMGVLSWLANTADRYALGILAGPAAVGQYVAPFAVASRAMAMIGAPLVDVLRPILFEATNRGDKMGARRVFLIWVALRLTIILAALAFLALFGPLIGRLLLAPAYRSGATPILMWVAAGYGVQGVVQTIETRLMSLDRTSWLIVPMGVGGLANLAFSFLLIPHFGAVGAGMATALSFVVQSAVVGWRLRQAERSAGF